MRERDGLCQIQRDRAGLLTPLGMPNFIVCCV